MLLGNALQGLVESVASGHSLQVPKARSGDASFKGRRLGWEVGVKDGAGGERPRRNPVVTVHKGFLSYTE